MTITKNHVVEIDYTLTSAEGEVIDSSEGEAPLAYLHGSNNIIPGLEKELEGKSKGDSLKVTVEPKEGYGEYQEQLITEVERKDLEMIPELEVGLQVQAETPQGIQVLTVTEINGVKVTLDGNHPLAGQTLHFDVTVANIREATAEELAHGHVHGPGGHNH